MPTASPGLVLFTSVLFFYNAIHESQNNIPKYFFLVRVEVGRREVDQSGNCSVVHNENLKW